MNSKEMNEKEFCERYYTERRGTNSLKWDALRERFGDPDLISMWVADMEFQTPECVGTALKKRAEHGVLGYSFVPDSYYQAVIDWEQRHHGYQVQKEWIRISPGVVSAIYWTVNLYTQPQDAVLILTPVYYPFHNAVKDSGRRLITCDLLYDNGRFSIDFEAFERKIVEEKVKLYIMSSPHNPAGRVWTREELDRMLQICYRHNVLVFSDEIHQDLVFDGHKHIPAALLTEKSDSRRLITAFAASKTFNLAGALTSTIVIEDEEMRRQWDKFVNVYHNVEVNILGITAVEAALRGGEEWYEALKRVLYSNYRLVVDGLKEYPKLRIAPLEGTYLVFLDLRGYVDPERIHEFTQKQCRLAVDYGEWFGENWKGFIRLNMGTHPDIVKQAVENIKKQLTK